MTWSPADFYIATAREPRLMSGYVYRDVGLYSTRPREWTLTHLASGCAICYLRGNVKKTFPIACKIAELTEWDFEDIEGWRNREPELGKKVRAICEENKRNADFGHHDYDPDVVVRYREMARAVSAKRKELLSHDGR